MTRAEKTAVIEHLKGKFAETDFFYLTDASQLTVERVNNLRRLCYEKGVEMKVVKNTLARKALEAADDSKNYSELYEALKGPTAIMFTDTANVPARLIKEFRKKEDRPFIKAAYIDSSVYLGDEQIEALAKLKSKEELLGELIGLLQSPIRNVMGALSSGGQTIMGLLKTLEERESQGEG